MSTRADQLADVATAAISIARKLQGRPFSDPAIIPLCHLDRIVLRQIHRFPGISPSKIAADLGLRQSNTSAAVRSLIGLGMVAKEADPLDRRAVRIHATELGEDSTARVRHEWSEMLETTVPAGMRTEDLAEAMVAIDDALNQHLGSSGAFGPDRTEPSAPAAKQKKK